MMFKNAKPNVEGPSSPSASGRASTTAWAVLKSTTTLKSSAAAAKPIEGLYAAGEVTGGVHGMVRLGTVAVADCMIFGRVAARQVAAKK